MKILLTVVTSLFFVACGSPNDDMSSTQDFPVNEKIKLYTEPTHKVVEGCDVFTQISLSADRKSADLVNRLIGQCKILVRAEPRSYQLEAVHDTQCGSQTLRGATRGASIEIV